MRIILDARPLLGAYKTGVGEYSAGLFAALLRAGSPHEYLFFVNAWRQPLISPAWTTARSRTISTRYPNKLLSLALATTGRPYLDRLVAARAGWKQADIFFSPNLHFTAVSPATAQVLLLHDLSFELFPYLFSARQRLWHRALNPRQQCQRARLIFVPSANTKRDLCQHYGLREEKIEVLSPGVPEGMGCTPLSPRAVRQKYGLPEKYILFVGTIEPRKNVDGLIRAFELCADQLPGYGLVLAGAPGWQSGRLVQRAAASRQARRIIFTGYVDPAEKAALYAGADVFVFPSWYEGFGFPVLEAMAAGLPVITSSRSSLSEVAGAAAYYINPHQPDEIAAGIVELLGNNPRRERLAALGRQRAAGFTWTTTAQEWLHNVQRLA